MRRNLRRILIWSALLLIVGSTPAAVASEVSTEEFTQLVRQAVDSQPARDRLASVTAVDGDPIDMTSILDGSTEEQQQRLESLARVISDPSVAAGADDLREQAAEITSQPPFAAELASSNPILEWIGRVLSYIFGGTAASVIGLLVIIGAVLLFGYVGLSRTVARQRRTAATRIEAPTPVDYRAEAEAAADSGEFGEAVRLLFLDGAQSLEEHRAVRDAATTTTATVRPLTDNAHFLDRFDEIAYGGALAQGEDVTEARSAWDRIQQRLRLR